MFWGVVAGCYKGSFTVQLVVYGFRAWGFRHVGLGAWSCRVRVLLGFGVQGKAWTKSSVGVFVDIVD